MAPGNTSPGRPRANCLVTDFSLHRRFVAALLLSTAALAVAALVAPSTAGATSATTCGKQIVDDWYGDERIDKIYPLHCYREAIRSLGVDLAVYTGAEDDILRALSYAKRNKQDPGDAGDKVGPDTTDTTETTGTGNDGPGVDPDKDDPPGKDTTPEVDTSGPSAVPLPLIVLAGLALLLLAAGGAGYLNRRAETRRIDGPDDLDD